jgi:serine/threonine-protein kinase HipA
LDKLKVAATSKIAFIDLIIFNYLIGNGDAHAKNFSILYKNDIPMLAPCYDLMCTAIMDPYYDKHKMAMKLCATKYFMNRVKRDNFAKLSEISGYRADFILKRLDVMSTKIGKEANKLANVLNSTTDTQSNVYCSIIKIIEKHVSMVQKK